MFEFFKDNWFILMLLICPLMHFFMHRGHGSHDKCQHKEKTASQNGQEEKKKHMDA